MDIAVNPMDTSSVPFGYNCVWGSGPSSIAEVPNLNFHSSTAKVSSSGGPKARLNGPESRDSISKHKHKKHSKHQKAGENCQV